jgi:hypothetical protein
MRIIGTRPDEHRFMPHPKTGAAFLASRRNPTSWNGRMEEWMIGWMAWEDTIAYYAANSILPTFHLSTLPRRLSFRLFCLFGSRGSNRFDRETELFHELLQWS